MAAGSIGSGGAPGFVAVRDWHSVTIFSGAPWSPLWNYTVSDIDAVAVANLDGIGADEIIVGDGQWGSIRIFDSQTRTLRLTIPNPGNSIPALTTVQTTNAPGKDIVFSAGTWGPESSVMRVVRSSDGVTLRELSTEFGGAGATTIGDFDADGRVELVVGNSGREPGRIRFVDRDTGVQEWVSPATAGLNDPFAMNPGFLFQAQLDTDPAMELVVAGNASQDGRIFVLDGLTKEVQLQIGNFSSSRPMPFRDVVGAVLLDYDADGFDDLAVITEPTSSGASGARLHVFSLSTGLVLWESITMGTGSSARGQGIFVQPGSGQDLLVAALPFGLRAFGVQSQLLEWTHDVPIQRAVYLPSAPGGAEIAVENEGGLVTHLDAATRAIRRSYQLSAPSKGIVPLPGAAYLLVAEVDGLSLRSMDGTVLGTAAEAIARTGPSPVAVVPRGLEFDVLTGLQFGHTLHTLNPDGVFAAGFEVD
jgi:hypothetical protein